MNTHYYEHDDDTGRRPRSGARRCSTAATARVLRARASTAPRRTTSHGRPASRSPTSSGSSGRRRSCTSRPPRGRWRSSTRSSRDASRGKTGEEALHAMGEAYTALIEDRERLHADAAVLRRAARTRRSARPCAASGATSSISSSASPASRPRSSARSSRRAMLLNVLMRDGALRRPRALGGPADRRAASSQA